MFYFASISLLLTLLNVQYCHALPATANGTVSNDTIASGIFFCGVEIKPEAPILKFDSTFIVPATAISNGGVGAVWPALEPVPELMQHAIANYVLNEWQFLPYFCCQPAEGNLRDRRVYPGDVLTIQYRWNSMSRTWYDNWIINPGVEGNAAGEVTMASGLELGPWDNLYAPNSDYSKPYAMLWIELQGTEVWDWGPIYWSDVLIEAQTQDTSWCTEVWWTANGRDILHWTRSTPIATWNADTGTTTCYIATITYEGHG